MQNKRCIRGRFSALKRPRSYNLVYHLRPDGALNVRRSLHADPINSTSWAASRTDHTEVSLTPQSIETMKNNKNARRVPSEGLNRPILCGQYKKEACKG